MKHFLSVFAIIASLLPRAASAGSYIYVTLLEERQIVTFEQDPESGELTRLRSIDTPAEPACMAVSADRDTLFVSLRSSGELASYHIDADTGELTLLSVVTGGADPAYLLPDASGRYLITAYYESNCVTVHALKADGAIEPEVLQVVPTAEKAHGLAFNNAQTELYVPHTGANRIYHFHFNGDTGELTPADPPFAATPVEDHPRHIALHPSGKWAYTSNEAGDSIGVFTIDDADGSLERIQTLSTIPDDFDGEQNSTARCEMSPDGRFVYVANRGHNSIACFAIDRETGLVTLLEQEPTEAVPRSFTIHRDGQFLYAAGEQTGRLAGFRIDPDGRLTRICTWDSGPISWWAFSVVTE
jgi:6-phosphogluconolactonase